MRLSEASVKRRITTLMVFATILVLGLVALRKIPLEFMPKMDMPFINIILLYPQASPSEICETIVEPIEEAISTMHGIKKINSRCRVGEAEIGVELTGKVKTDYLVLETKERIDQIREELPKDLGPVIIMKFDTEQWPVIFAALTFPTKKEENNDLVEELIAKPLRNVEGVARVEVFGQEEKRVKVELDESRLASLRINVLQIYEALISSNMNVSIGSIEHKGQNYSVRVRGEFRTLDEIRALKIAGNVKLGDVAKVDYEYVKQDIYGRLNLKPAYILAVNKEAGINTVEVCRHVKAKLNELLANPQLKGVEYKTWFDQSEEISKAVNTLSKSGLEGAVLTFFVLIGFLRSIRAVLIVILSIPMSIMATIAIMYFLGLSFNMVTLSGMVVAIGMLVDNSIVVFEAIYSRFQKGHNKEESAVKGADEVGLAISISTYTTVIVFLPLVFNSNRESAIMMIHLGGVLSISILMSLLVSLTLIPLLSSQLLSAQAVKEVRWVLRVEGWFTKRLNWCLDNRFKTILGVLVLFGFSVGLFFIPGLIEKEALPKSMVNMVRVQMVFERKPPAEELNERMEELERLFFQKKDEWEVETVSAIIGKTFARLNLVLKEDREPSNTAEVLKERIEKLLSEKVHWPGISFRVETMSFGQHEMGGASPTTIKVRGDDPDQVYYFAEALRSRLAKIKVIKSVGEIEKENQKEIHIEIDRTLAEKYGVDPTQAAMSITYSIRGVEVGKFNTSERQLDLYLQLEEADRKSISQLEQLSVKNLAGQSVPLKSFAKLSLKGVPEVIRRENRRFTVRIPITPAIRDLGIVKDEIQKALIGYTLPKGYSWVMGEEYQEMLDTLYTLLESLLLAVILVFIIMAAQFESFLLPLVVMVTLPLGTIGACFALLITRSSLNVLSGAGCLLLVGIVVNNSIVLVDHINNLRKRGLSERDSLVQGMRDRIRPIMMTALTTIIGLLPMALSKGSSGGIVYAPLAVAVMGGLLASTFFTPLVIPLAFSLATDLSKALKRGLRYVLEA